jgi:hypothetical protein
VNTTANEVPNLIIYFRLVERPQVLSCCFMLAAIVNGIGDFLIELTVITLDPLLLIID